MAEAVVVGSVEADHVCISVLSRMHPGATDYWDGNWVDSPISIRTGGFTARIGAGLRMDEIQRFTEGLRSMNQNLVGIAILSSVEGWIGLTVRCEPNGALTVTGEAADEPGSGNHLSFELDGLDQTHLRTWINALEEIEREFPVIGHP